MKALTAFQKHFSGYPQTLSLHIYSEKLPTTLDFSAGETAVHIE